MKTKDGAIWKQGMTTYVLSVSRWQCSIKVLDVMLNPAEWSPAGLENALKTAHYANKKTAMKEAKELARQYIRNWTEAFRKL